MRLRDQLRGLRHTFTAHRARAALTLLGIVIGSGSIIMLAGLLRGAEEALMRMNQGVHSSDIVRIRSDDPPRAQQEKTRRELGRSDADALANAQSLERVEIATEATRESRAEWHGKQKRVRLVGAAPHALEMYRLSMAKGRFLVDEDMVLGPRVAIIGHEVWTELLDKNPDPIGLQLTIDGNSWTIAGVLAHKPTMGHGDGTWMWDRKVLVPEKTFDAAFEPTHKVNSIFLRGLGATAAQLAATAETAKQILLRRHLGVQNFKLEDRAGKNQERLIIDIIEILLLGTGLMSLFVGGINIMNIMLVTVTERTREIGIRRAVGASPRAILMQFLLEAAAISSLGGLLGLIGGVALSWLTVQGLSHAFGGWNFHVEAWSVALGLGLALLTGLVFGLFPAWRAARLNPVEALRYE